MVCGLHIVPHYIRIQPHAPIELLNAFSFAPLYDIDIVGEHIPGETNHAGGGYVI